MRERKVHNVLLTPSADFKALMPVFFALSSSHFSLINDELFKHLTESFRQSNCREPIVTTLGRKLQVLKFVKTIKNIKKH